MDVILSEVKLENVSQVFFFNVFPFRTRQFTSRKLIIYTNTDMPTDTQNDVHSGPFIIEKYWKHFKCSPTGSWLI